MESSHPSQLAKSLSNLYQIVEIYNSTCRSRARSLPNIILPPPSPVGGGESQCQYCPYPYPPEFISGGGPVKKHNHNKILKKTWDKVKTAIIHTTTSHAYRRSSLNKSKLDSGPSKQGMNLPQCSTSTTTTTNSAPSTPLHKQTFEFDNQQQISPQPNTNQKLEQAQLNRPQHDFLRSVSANAGDMRGHQQETLWMEKSPTRFEDGEEHEKGSVSTTQTNMEEESQKIQQNYAKLQKRLSEELHQRMSEHKPPDSKTIENLSEDFKKRLRQWEMWRVSTGKVTYTDEEIAQILPLEFSQKLHEWETIKTSGAHSQAGGRTHGQHSKTPDSLGSGSRTSHARDTSSPEVLPASTKNKLLRKKKSSSESSRQKELAWLDKQLEKIEVEKKRLEREMKKYVEREARLEKMKEALQNASPSEVWIRTPTGKCKVEKLTEKFTKKLYQWEEMHGIQPESSTMALLHPKYYGPPPTGDEEDAEIEIRRAQAEFNSRRYNDDTPAVSSARESESRQDECDPDEHNPEPVSELEDEGTEHEDNEELYDQEEDKDDHQMKEPHHEEQEHGLSSASSSDFEEVTDSFATHDKGNSGASNTDSDFNYRAEFPSCRRRSSEAISTPLSARSPSLSAFTSDDEAETCGLLKTVSEENENTNTLKDAESQTEVILRAKPVLVEDDEENAESLYGDESQSGIFVQTKRTIFTPILDGSEPEKTVLIGGELLKSPSQVRKAIQETQTDEPLEIRTSTPNPIPTSPEDILPFFSSSSNSFSIAPKISRIPSPIPPLTPVPKTSIHPKPPPPRIVEVTPKAHPGATPGPSQLRSFPKMGKLPVWCSPLGTRRHLGSGSIQSESGGLISQHSSSAMDFSTDRFLAESSYFSHPPVPCSSTSLVTSTSTSSPPPPFCPSGSGNKFPFNNSNRGRGGRRNTSATTPLPEESGIVGAGIQTGQRHPAFPVRSSSFRLQRNVEHQGQHDPELGIGSPGSNKGFYAQLRSRVSIGSVAKSQSTGSIRSKLGKAFSTFTNKISPKEQHQGQGASPEQRSQGGQGHSGCGGNVNADKY